MRWSFKLGRIFGISFRIHVTFLLLLWFVFMAGLSKKGTAEAVGAVLFVCAIFACVLIHELGHCLIARQFGTQAKSITLLPIGGVASMEEGLENPEHEIAISIIGPLINLAIAGVLYLLVGRSVGVALPNLFPDSVQSFFAGLIGANIILAVFNLIPAFPMDGGRVLRGIVALKADYVWATSVAVFVGEALALLFIFYGIFFNWWLTLIGIFIYLGAGAEKRQVMLHSLLREVPASAAMATDFRILKPDELLSRSLEHIYHGCQEDFPVVGDSGIQGILTRTGMIAAIHEKGVDIAVSEAVDRDFLSVDPQMPLDKVYRQLLSGGKSVAVVLDGTKIKGMLSLESVSRYFMIRSALKGIPTTRSSIPKVAT